MKLVYFPLPALQNYYCKSHVDKYHMACSSVFCYFWVFHQKSTWDQSSERKIPTETQGSVFSHIARAHFLESGIRTKMRHRIINKRYCLPARASGIFRSIHFWCATILESMEPINEYSANDEQKVTFWPVSYFIDGPWLHSAMGMVDEKWTNSYNQRYWGISSQNCVSFAFARCRCCLQSTHIHTRVVSVIDRQQRWRHESDDGSDCWASQLNSAIL